MKDFWFTLFIMFILSLIFALPFLLFGVDIYIVAFSIIFVLLFPFAFAMIPEKKKPKNTYYNPKFPCCSYDD